MGKYNLSNERNKDWLYALLIEKFGKCKNHQEKFNGKNMFCLDCRVSFCRHGKESHSLHRKLQIYKNCYEVVVKYSALVKYYDCSHIQTYVINKDKTVHLIPKVASLSNEFQFKGTITSTPGNKRGRKCEECGKHLQDKRNRFCSIRCKMSIEELGLTKYKIEELGVNQNDPSQNSEAQSSISISEPYEYVERVNLRKRPRKSAPMRSLSSFVYCN